MKALLGAGWRVLVLWECATRGPRRMSSEAVLEESFEFIVGAADWDHDDTIFWEIAAPTPRAPPQPPSSAATAAAAAGARRIWNGRLSTMPSSSDDQR